MTVIGDGPSIKRVHLPVDFDGPICAKCEHVHVPKNTDSHRDWTCKAVKPEVLRPAETNPITGDVSEVKYKHRKWCADRNERGDCKDFQRKAGS